jgi:hypothetical protein
VVLQRGKRKEYAMRNGLKLILVLVAAMVTGVGCMDVAYLVSVNKDGSGTVEQVVIASAMMSQMMQGMGEGGEVFPIEEEKYKAQAAKMGTGVSYVKAEKVNLKDGRQGLRVKFAFDDVRQVKFSPEMENDQPAAAGASEKEEEPITFGFEEGLQPTLTVRLPHDTGAEAAASGATPPEPPAEQLAMMKQMMAGLRMRIFIKVDGEITKTNAAHVKEINGKKVGITVMDLNFDTIAKDDAAFKKLMTAGAGGEPSFDDMVKLSQEIEGLDIEPAEEVSLTFE